MPATPPTPARRGTARTRITAASSSPSSLTSGSSTRPGTTTTTSTTTSTTTTSSKSQSSVQPRSNLALGRRSLSVPFPSRPGRPRKDPTPTSTPTEDSERPRRTRGRPPGRPPKARESTEEFATPPASGSSSVGQDHANGQDRDHDGDHDGDQDEEMEHEQREDDDDAYEDEQEQETRSSRLSAAKETPMDVEKEEPMSQSPTTKKSTSTRHSTRQLNDMSKGISRSTRQSSGNNSSSGGSEAPEQRRQQRARSSQVSEDRDAEEASSGSEDDGDEGEADSDDGQPGGSAKNKQQKTTTTLSKRRLRSSRLMPSVVAHLGSDSNGLSIEQILEEYTEEQQLFRATTSAAEALTKLFRHGIQESESLHSDMVDAQDYELIRHTFGEIEDLDLNLTCPLPTSDERDMEDDDMTNDLKQKFRRAWQNLTDVCAEYKAVKRSMRIQMVSKLDAEEAQIKAGTHPDLLAELKAIEDRREARTKVVRAQKDYLQRMWEINFQAVCKASNDQYLAGQVTARRSIIELVQSRMNKIKQEMSQSRRAAGLVTPRRLTIVRPTKVTEYDSCDESCSSYDSYSSSGSECSDCEVCIPTRHLQIPQLKIPRGLSRREVAVDLAFLFPESNPTHSRPRPADGYTASGYSRQVSPEAGDDGGRRPKIGKNQQFMIDHLNDEKRRKRRVMDREMQSKTTYKTHSGSEKEGRNGDIGSEERDMEVDADQDPDAYLPQEYEAESPTRSGLVNSPRNHSPIIVRSAPRLSSAKSARHYRPRFLPGFGPDGLQNSHKHAKRSTTNAGHMPRYPIADRQGRPWDPSRPGVAAPPVTIRDEVRPYPLMERESARMHGVRPTYDSAHQDHRNGGSPHGGGRGASPLHDPRKPPGHSPTPPAYDGPAEGSRRPQYPPEHPSSSVLRHTPRAYYRPRATPYSAEEVYPFDDETMQFRNPHNRKRQRMPAPPPLTRHIPSSSSQQQHMSERHGPLPMPMHMPAPVPVHAPSPVPVDEPMLIRERYPSDSYLQYYNPRGRPHKNVRVVILDESESDRSGRGGGGDRGGGGGGGGGGGRESERGRERERDRDRDRDVYDRNENDVAAARERFYAATTNDDALS